MAKARPPVETYEQEQAARAAYFTAFKFRGRGRHEKHKARTMAEAEEIGRQLGGAMIYAVTPEGFSVHIKNV